MPRQKNDKQIIIVATLGSDSEPSLAYNGFQLVPLFDPTIIYWYNQQEASRVLKHLKRVQIYTGIINVQKLSLLKRGGGTKLTPQIKLSHGDANKCRS